MLLESLNIPLMYFAKSKTKSKTSTGTSVFFSKRIILETGYTQYIKCFFFINTSLSG